MTARKKSLTQLGETEMEVLHHVWDLGEATVADVRERVLDEREVAYTTVMTVMKKLADKGYLRFRKDGRTYVYSAAQPPGQVQHSLLSRLMDSVFHGSPMALVQTLVRHEPLSDDDRREIARLIREMEEADADNPNAKAADDDAA